MSAWVMMSLSHNREMAAAIDRSGRVQASPSMIALLVLAAEPDAAQARHLDGGFALGQQIGDLFGAVVRLDRIDVQIVLGLGDHGAEPLLEQDLVVEGLLHQLAQAVQLVGLDLAVTGAGLEIGVAVTLGAHLVVDQVIGEGGDERLGVRCAETDREVHGGLDGVAFVGESGRNVEDVARLHDDINDGIERLAMQQGRVGGKFVERLAPHRLASGACPPPG